MCIRDSIGIVGASGGAGATFIATSLAVAMAALGAGTAFLQTHLCGCPECLSRPLPYYEPGLDNAFLPGRFADLFALKHAGGRTDNRANPVSYTHLYVYKRQSASSSTPSSIIPTPAPAV